MVLKCVYMVSISPYLYNVKHFFFLSITTTIYTDTMFLLCLIKLQNQTNFYIKVKDQLLYLIKYSF